MQENRDTGNQKYNCTDECDFKTKQIDWTGDMRFIHNNHPILIVVSQCKTSELCVLCTPISKIM